MARLKVVNSIWSVIENRAMTGMFYVNSSYDEKYEFEVPHGINLREIEPHEFTTSDLNTKLSVVINYKWLNNSNLFVFGTEQQKAAVYNNRSINISSCNTFLRYELDCLRFNWFNCIVTFIHKEY